MVLQCFASLDISKISKTLQGYWTEQREEQNISNGFSYSLDYVWFLPKCQLNSERIYVVIVSPKMPTKNLKDFCPESLLEGRAEIFQIFGWHFGRNNDLIKFILNLTDL